jgi:hypothetical protein
MFPATSVLDRGGNPAQRPFPRLRRHWRIFLLLSLWTGLYFVTTSISPRHGLGGLSGPMNVRMFKSVGHLIAFYPQYLVERVIRNRSLTAASYRFNCDFEDRDYKWSWLYGDGKYGSFWCF